MRAASVLFLLALAGCGSPAPLEPPPGGTLPPAVPFEPTATVSTAAELLRRAPQADPDRTDEILKRSEDRQPDRFDLPPD